MSDSPYFVTNKNDHLDFVTNPDNLVRAMPHYRQVFDHLKDEREMVDHFTSQVRYSEKRAGGKVGFKLLARMPESVLTYALVLEPNLLKDKKTFRRFMAAHPEYAGYTGVKV